MQRLVAATPRSDTNFLSTALHLTTAEAAGWERLARALHEEAPTGGLGAAPETVFGSLDALTVG